MHIEPGILSNAKLLLSGVTAVGSAGLIAKMGVTALEKDGGVLLIAVRSLCASVCVFGFFEILPHYPVGVSEVHFIFASSLYLVFGAFPTAIGLVFGLLLQGLIFAPTDLPQYAANVTTLIFPLFFMSLLASRYVISQQVAYKDLEYFQVLKLSASYQVGIVSWVSFWVFYGQGFSQQSFEALGAFGLAYLSVIIVEPLLDMALLAGAKKIPFLQKIRLFSPRLYHPGL